MEDIVQAPTKVGDNLNKVSVLEGADGSPLIFIYSLQKETVRDVRVAPLLASQGKGARVR